MFAHSTVQCTHNVLLISTIATSKKRRHLYFEYSPKWWPSTKYIFIWSKTEMWAWIGPDFHTCWGIRIMALLSSKTEFKFCWFIMSLMTVFPTAQIKEMNRSAQAYAKAISFRQIQASYNSRCWKWANRRDWNWIENFIHILSTSFFNAMTQKVLKPVATLVQSCIIIIQFFLHCLI